MNTSLILRFRLLQVVLLILSVGILIVFIVESATTAPKPPTKDDVYEDDSDILETDHGRYDTSISAQ